MPYHKLFLFQKSIQGFSYSFCISYFNFIQRVPPNGAQLMLVGVPGYWMNNVVKEISNFIVHNTAWLSSILFINRSSSKFVDLFNNKLLNESERVLTIELSRLLITGWSISIVVQVHLNLSDHFRHQMNI